MAPLNADTKLMDNFVVGAPVADVRDFFALCDENHEPMMLSLDKSSGQLTLVHNNPVTKVANMHTPIPPPSADYIWKMEGMQGVSVFQHPTTMEIRILTCSRYAQNARGMTRPLTREGLFFLVRGPFMPADLKAGKIPDNGRVELLIQDREDRSPTQLEQVMLGPALGGMPFSIMAKTSNDSIHETWIYNSSQSVPEFQQIDINSHPFQSGAQVENTIGQVSLEILDVQCGARGNANSDEYENPGGSLITTETGIWVLRLVSIAGYQKAGLHLAFYAVRNGLTHRHDHLTELVAVNVVLTTLYIPTMRDFTATDDAIPALRASRVTQFFDETNRYRLLLVGGGKAGLVAADGKNTSVNIIGQGPTFNTTYLHSTQQRGEVRLWSKIQLRNNTGQLELYLGWLSFSTSSLTSPQHASLGEFQLFAGTRNDTVVRACCTCMNAAHDQHVMTLDGQDVKVVSQSRQTGLWAKAQSFFSFPKITEITTMQTYTTHISFKRMLKSKDRNVEVSVKEGSHVMWLNGTRHAIVAGTPIKLSLAASESLNVMQESSDLSAGDFTINDVTSNVSETFSPNEFLMAKLKNVTAQDLATHGAKPDRISLEQAALQLRGLSVRAHQLAPAGPVIMLAAGTLSTEALSLGSWLEDKWHWLEDQGHKAIKTISDDFTSIEIWVGEKTHTLLLNTVQAVTRAGQAILSGLVKARDAVVSFLDGAFDIAKILQRTIEIDTALVSILDYGQKLVDDSIDDLVLTVRHHFGVAKKDFDKFIAILEQFGDANEAINQMNKPGTIDDMFQHSAKLSVLTTAPTKSKGIKYPAPPSSKGHSGIFKEAKEKADAAIDAKPNLYKDLKKVLEDVQDMFAAGATFKGILKLVKDTFDLLIDTADILIETILGLLKSLVDLLINALKEPMAIPIISPLLRLWNWMTGSHVSLNLPSATFMTGFMLAVFSVEFENLGIVPAPKNSPVFGVASMWPNHSKAQNDVKAWFTKEKQNPTPVAPQNNVHVSIAAFSSDPNNPDPPPPAPSWDGKSGAQKYSEVNSYAHPIILGVHWLTDCFNVPGALFEAALGNSPLGVSPLWTRITGGIKIALSLCELAFTFPAAAKRPSKDLMIIGWAFSCAAFGTNVVNYVAGYTGLAKSEGLKIGCAILLFSFTITKNILSSIAVHEQKEWKATSTNTADWDDDNQKDDKMLDLTIGNITCSFAIALSEIVAEGALVYFKKSDDPDGLLVFGGAEAIALIAAIPDIGVDSARSHLEHQPDYAHMGAYSSGCSRR